MDLLPALLCSESRLSHTSNQAGGCLLQLDLERKLRTLLTKEKEKAEEEAALAMGLCTGGAIF